MKKRLFLLFALTILLTIPNTVYASNAYTTAIKGIATPCADQIEKKIRFYNNKFQYRRWNVTKGYWVDSAWIDM